MGENRGGSPTQPQAVSCGYSAILERDSTLRQLHRRTTFGDVTARIVTSKKATLEREIAGRLAYACELNIRFEIS